MTERKNLGWSAKEYAELAGFDTDWRDSWWNQDYLELLARRLRLAEVRDVLDVGCGAGHWGQRVGTLLEPGAKITGVDHEPGFLEAARARAEGRPGAYVYREGDASALPFEDDRFDLVTCQTVLIHVPDARAALVDMLRVLRPGGLLLAAEPNNLVNALVKRQGIPDLDDDALFAQARDEVRGLRGKRALGHGDSTIGEALPALFLELGLRDRRVYTNECTATMLAPYTSPATKAAIDMLRQAVESETTGLGDEASARRQFVAGGGDETRFTAHWAAERHHQKRSLEAVDAGTYTFGGGFLMYVVAGRKPSDR